MPLDLSSERDWWKVHLYHLLGLVPGLPLGVLLLFLLFMGQVALGLTSGGGQGFESMTQIGAIVAMAPLLMIILTVVGTWIGGLFVYYLDAKQLRKTGAEFQPLWPVYTVAHLLLGPLTVFFYLVRRYLNTEMAVRG